MSAPKMIRSPSRRRAPTEQVAAESEVFLDHFDVPAPDVELGDPGKVSVVALCFNEIVRLPHFLDHYRSIGVERFFIVDNGSDDGSGPYLDAQPDVVRLPSSKPYKDHVVAWRRLIADRYLQGRWVLFPDVDELFVYPGWPDAPLDRLVEHWERVGAECVFASMVDMYPAGPIGDLAYRAGETFLEACPLFDGCGYRLVPKSGKSTPPFILLGGARERLFFSDPNALDPIARTVTALVLSPKRRLARGRLRKYLEWRAKSWLASRLPPVSQQPNMSKVPLVKWRRGLRFRRGPHSLNATLRLAPDWGALLHFKYLDDFAAKTRQAIERKQHDDGAALYTAYDRRMERMIRDGAAWSGSRRFRSVADLEDVGLLRCSTDLRRALIGRPPRWQQVPTHSYQSK